MPGNPYYDEAPKGAGSSPYATPQPAQRGATDEGMRMAGATSFSTPSSPYGQKAAPPAPAPTGADYYQQSATTAAAPAANPVIGASTPPAPAPASTAPPPAVPMAAAPPSAAPPAAPAPPAAALSQAMEPGSEASMRALWDSNNDPQVHQPGLNSFEDWKAAGFPIAGHDNVAALVVEDDGGGDWQIDDQLLAEWGVSSLFAWNPAVNNWAFNFSGFDTMNNKRVIHPGDILYLYVTDPVTGARRATNATPQMMATLRARRTPSRPAAPVPPPQGTVSPRQPPRQPPRNTGLVYR